MSDKVKKIAELTFELLTNCQEKEDRLSAQLNISSPEVRVLRRFHGEKQLAVKVLVERINLSGSRLTRILDVLEKKQYLVRTIDPKDRRGIMVTLTKSGIALSAKLEKNYFKFHQDILKEIPEALHEPMIAGMDNMLKALRTWLKKT